MAEQNHKTPAPDYAAVLRQKENLAEWLTLLVYRVETTREAQRDARAHKLASRQKKADELEATLDAAVRELKRRGINTDALRARLEQKPLF